MSVKVMGDEAAWDKLVDDSPHGMLFHKWGFLKLIESHTGYKLLPYGVYRGNELSCVFPIFYKRKMGLKMVFSPPPGTAVPYLGPVMAAGYHRLKQRKKEHYLSEVIEEMNTEISRLSPDYAFVSLVPDLADVRPFKWGGYDSSAHFTYMIDLSSPLERIWDGFGKDCKNSIRKCSKGSAALKQSPDADAFYDIMKERYRQQGLSLPIVSKEYLSGIVRLFPGNVMPFYTMEGDEIRDIELACGYKGRFMLWLGGAIIDKGAQGYQEYATWELIKKAKESGYKEFEIAGAGVRRICAFQSKFNPSLVMSMSISKKKLAGKAAEIAYINFIRKMPLRQEM